MQQELKSNGSNPNPMFFWQYVLKKDKNRTVPRILVEGDWEIDNLILDHPELDWVLENFNCSLRAPHILKRDWLRLSYKTWLKDLNRTDYMLCVKEDRDIWIQAGLCGVELIHSVDELTEVLRGPKVLDSVARIDNWERTKNLLTK